MATKYSEALLAVKYRVRTADGTMLGGPMYALLSNVIAAESRRYLTRAHLDDSATTAAVP